VPKIIEDLEEKIIDQLARMFHEDQEDISLRSLARQTGIAVGTIYNYFPNKEELLKALFKKEWSLTLQKVRKKLKTASGNREKLYLLVKQVYEDFEKICRTHRKRIRLLHRPLKNSGESLPFPLRAEGWLWLVDAFRPVWREIFPGEKELDRLTPVVVPAIQRLAIVYPDRKEENLTFIVHLIQHGVKPDHENNQ
jgi:AcrR family transcriptional regulator